jgi:glycosyltransferase involved in cell wall biosynthesis
MRILLINKNHYVKSGVERAYFDMAEILRSQGHEAAFFSMKDPKNEPTKWDKFFIEAIDYNAENLSTWKKIKIAQKFIFNFEAKKNLEKMILDFKPDIAHLHNIYHHLSPSVIFALKKHSVPMVMTVHDYNLISPNYNLYLNGKIWEKKNYFSCIKDRCVKNSYAKSALKVLEIIVHKQLKSYGKIDLFISPSKFLIEKFQEFGFKGKMKHLPNPLRDASFDLELSNDQSGPLVYFGRLSKEKGIEVAIRALQNLPESEKLQIVGEGPEREALEKLVFDLNLQKRVSFLGFKSGEDLANILKNAKAIIIPSVWFENMPYTILEAMAKGKIVIGSRIGGISELIRDKENGFLFEMGNERDLAEKIKSLEKSDIFSVKKEAKKSVLEFSFEKYYEKIMGIYESLIASRKN